MTNTAQSMTDQTGPTNPSEDAAIANNDIAETWDQLCGPDPNWRDALENHEDSNE